MTQNITPMRRVSESTKELRKMLSLYFKDFTLNKVEPHYIPYNNRDDESKERTKGVENDFVNVFKSKLGDISFAFTYTYIDKKTEEQTINVSIKKAKENDSIITSQEYSIDEFKVKLNELRKNIKEKKIETDIDVIEIVSEIFIGKLDLKKTLNEATKQIQKIAKAKTKELDIETLGDNIIALQKDLKKAEKKLSNFQTNADTKKRIEELERKVVLLKNQEKREYENKQKELGILDLNKAIEEAQSKYENAIKEFDLTIRKEKEKIPEPLRRRVKI